MPRLVILPPLIKRKHEHSRRLIVEEPTISPQIVHSIGLRVAPPSEPMSTQVPVPPLEMYVLEVVRLAH